MWASDRRPSGTERSDLLGVERNRLGSPTVTDLQSGALASPFIVSTCTTRVYVELSITSCPVWGSNSKSDLYPDPLTPLKKGYPGLGIFPPMSGFRPFFVGRSNSHRVPVLRVWVRKCISSMLFAACARAKPVANPCFYRVSWGSMVKTSSA